MFVASVHCVIVTGAIVAFIWAPFLLLLRYFPSYCNSSLLSPTLWAPLLLWCRLLKALKSKSFPVTADIVVDNNFSAPIPRTGSPLSVLILSSKLAAATSSQTTFAPNWWLSGLNWSDDSNNSYLELEIVRLCPDLLLSTHDSVVFARSLTQIILSYPKFKLVAQDSWSYCPLPQSISCSEWWLSPAAFNPGSDT